MADLHGFCPWPSSHYDDIHAISVFWHFPMKARVVRRRFPFQIIRVILFAPIIEPLSGTSAGFSRCNPIQYNLLDSPRTAQVGVYAFGNIALQVKTYIIKVFQQADRCVPHTNCIFDCLIHVLDRNHALLR